MTNDEMKAELEALNIAANQRLGRPMYIPLSLRLSGNWWEIWGYSSPDMKWRLESPNRYTPEDAFIAMWNVIGALPTEAERDMQEFQKKVAEAIDFGNEKGIAAEWLNPIVSVARAMAENALPKPEVAK